MIKDYQQYATKLVLPAYGRNIQNMVERCLAIHDREERQYCAETIVKIMSSITTADRARDDFEQILWDHLYIMSDFQLDIDFPYPVTSREAYISNIERKLNNDHQYRPRYHHYGRSIERMIALAKQEQDDQTRQLAAGEIAVQMKRDYINWNKETVANTRIFAELYELSEGQLYLDEMIIQLPDADELRERSTYPGTKKPNSNRRKR